MKKIVSLILSIALIISAITILPSTTVKAISADDYKIGDNAYWKTEVDENGTISLIIYGSGPTYNYIYNSSKDRCSTPFVLGNSYPIEVDGYLQNFAAKSATRVVIKKGITSIGNGLFNNLSKASEFVFESETDIKSVGDYAFYKCGVEKIILPSSITSIGNNAFALSSIKSFTVPSGTKTLGNYAFANCKNMSSFEFSKEQCQVNSIGERAFENCTALTRFGIPVSIKSIGSYAFAGCTNLNNMAYYGTPSSWNNVSKGTNWYNKNVSIQLATPYITSISNEASGISIAWGSIPNAEKYRILRKTTGGSYSTLAETTSTSYLDKTAVAGVTYVYTVCCISKDGSSVTSNYDPSGKSLQRITTLSTPNLVKVVCNASGLKLTYSTVPNAKGYYIYRKAKSELKWTRIGNVKNGLTASYTDKKVENNVNYTYTVKAYNGDIVSSYIKAGISTTYLKMPEISGITCNTTNVIVNWKAVPGAVRYKIYRRSENGSWQALGYSTSTKFNDKTATTNNVYYYTVRCVDAAKNYTSYYDTIGTKYNYRTTPTGFRGTFQTSPVAARIDWNAIPNMGTDKYKVFRKTDGTSWTCIGVTSDTHIWDYNMQNGVKYYYTVRTIDQNGNYTSSYNQVGFPYSITRY